ncbi:hypothetical protein BIW53_13165 [Pseudoalteromonas byunsanensis]|uniref:Uncharacterized protein n=1 Tax=Pseudoalteromonas byunsanensis TaxID=327939 RepID=A0A1S1N6B6_9GAMM|nr:hypothetical protein BIW53_13165 [Pseudoalteromonas byunsanensis]
MLPIITFSNGFWEIGLASAIAFILLFHIDPVFKFYRSKVAKFHSFMLWSFAIGVVISILAFYFPENSGKLVALWGIPTFILSFKFVRQGSKLVYK